MCFRVFCLLRAVWGVCFVFRRIKRRLRALLHHVIGGVHETQKSAFSDFTPKLSLFPHISVNGSPPSKAVATNSGTQRDWGPPRALVILAGLGHIGFAKSGWGGQIWSPNL